MKKIKYIIVGLFFLCTNSCKKNGTTVGNSALNVIHAVVNVNSIAINFIIPPIPFYQNQNFIGFASSNEYGLPSGVNQIAIVSSNDTTQPLFVGTFNFKSSGIYSLYLAGQTSSIDTVFMQDVIPVYMDSSSGIRFINLSPDSKPLSINIEGNSLGQTEFNNLSYKQITNFKPYSVNVSVGGSYSFEIRDQGTDSLLTTFTWNYPLQKNNTIVICGLESNGLNIFQVNNY